MAFLKSDLTHANDKVAEVRHRIIQQRATIQRLRVGGDDTKAAEDVLRSMVRTLEVFEGDRRQIEDERVMADSG